MTAALDAAARARDLIARVHGDGELARTSPLVFDPALAGGTGRLIALEEEGAVRSACAILPRDFLVDGAAIRVGLIGSVATDPACRNRGWATRLLEQAQAELARAGCAFALLWADDARFYLERGFSPVGAEDDFLLVSELALSLPEPRGVREMRAQDAPAIQRLYERHRERAARTVEETSALLGAPAMTTLVRERPRGAGEPAELVAYACLGRGRDLADAIHEWAGDSEDVLALVRAQLERRFPSGEQGALFLIAPPSASDLAYRLLRIGALSKRGILGLGRILDRARAAQLLGARLGAEGSATLVEGAEGPRFRIHGPRSEGQLDDDGALALLLGASDVRGEVARFLARFGLEHARLPLELFAWGLDSI